MGLRREVVAKYSDEMKVVAEKLLGIISESLGLESTRIADAIGGDFYQNITVSYYPPCPQPNLTLGLQSHSDMGAITLLIQDQVEGLQLFKDSHWITVPPLPHAILVLLADQTEVLTFLFLFLLLLFILIILLFTCGFNLKHVVDIAAMATYQAP